jgi:hypothetical protein
MCRSRGLAPGARAILLGLSRGSRAEHVVRLYHGQASV